jgi:hypothetical protein
VGIGYVGASAQVATNGAAPGAITPHANTRVGDLMLLYHYSRATGGDETVTAPSGGTSWNTIFNTVTANQGLVAVFWKFRPAGETTYTCTVTNHTSGTTGEAILEWIETYRFVHSTAPIGSSTASLSTWASSLNIGAISAPADTALPPNHMVIVYGGRFENVATQTLLTGDNLTWTAGFIADTTSGSDAGAVTQRGVNLTASSQTITAKTITTTGTTQAGAGRMFVLVPADLTCLIGGSGIIPVEV